MIKDAEILDLLKKAQSTLPEDKQQGFIERAVARIGPVLQDHKNALIGAGVGWVVGEIADRLPIVKYFTGDHASTVGAVIGAWIGHAKDKKEQAAREQIARVVAEELQATKG